jgi:hypothetical protein
MSATHGGRALGADESRARGLGETAVDWPGSSARANLVGRNDGAVTTVALLDRVADFPGLLEAAEAAVAVR